MRKKHALTGLNLTLPVGALSCTSDPKMTSSGLVLPGGMGGKPLGIRPGDVIGGKLT